jgi:hypothetical protein
MFFSWSRVAARPEIAAELSRQKSMMRLKKGQ